MTSCAFYLADSIYGAAVSWWTDSLWVHVAVQHTVASVPCVTEASPKRGVVLTRRDNAKTPQYVIELPFISDADALRVLSNLWSTPYGWSDIGGFVLRRNRNGHGIICSELVALLLLDAVRVGTFPSEWSSMRQFLESVPTNKVTPSDLARMLGAPIIGQRG